MDTEGHTGGSLLIIRESVLVMSTIAPQDMRAIVGRMSKSLGHNGKRKSWPRWVVLYTDNVCPATPTIEIPARQETTQRRRRNDSIPRATRTLFSYPASRASNSWYSGVKCGLVVSIIAGTVSIARLEFYRQVKVKDKE